MRLFKQNGVFEYFIVCNLRFIVFFLDTLPTTILLKRKRGLLQKERINGNLLVLCKIGILACT